MRDKTSSRTALATAYLRAAHQLIDPGPRVIDDPVALPLLGPGAEQRIYATKDSYMSDRARELRAHVVLRSRYAEDRLQSSIARGIRQYILIGAGFDTFAFRQPSWAAGLRIIEVDHPDTQHSKLSRLRDAGIAIPGNVDFIAADFEKESLEECFIRAGVHTGTRTFFSWLGVTMYLSEAAIDAALRCLAAFPGMSEAVISFMQPPALSPFSHRLAGRALSAGEPIISCFTCEEFSEKLLSAGFSEVLFLTPELSAAFFPEDESPLPNPRRTSIASALV